MAPGSGWPARSQAHARPHLAIRLGHPAAAAAAAALVSLPTRRAIVAAAAAGGAAAAEEIRTWDRDDNEFLQSTAWTTAYSTYVMLFRAVRRSALCTPLLFLHIYRCAWRYNLDFTLNLMIHTIVAKDNNICAHIILILQSIRELKYLFLFWKVIGKMYSIPAYLVNNNNQNNFEDVG